MSAGLAEEPCLIHAIPGRVRVHVPGWSGHGRHAIEARLGQVPGVRSVRATPLTGNILIRFEPAETDAQTILATVRTLDLETDAVRRAPPDGATVSELTRWLDQNRPRRGPDRAPFAPSVRVVGRQPRAYEARQLSRSMGLLPCAPNPAQPIAISPGPRATFGRDVADLLRTATNVLGLATGIASLILSSGPLSLLLSGAELLRLVGEVLARRAARRRYERRGAAACVPLAAVIRLEAGERSPQAVVVLEDAGLAALSVPVASDAAVTARAGLYGGPFVLEVHSEALCRPEPHLGLVAVPVPGGFPQATDRSRSQTRRRRSV